MDGVSGQDACPPLISKDGVFDQDACPLYGRCNCEEDPPNIVVICSWN